MSQDSPYPKNTFYNSDDRIDGRSQLLSWLSPLEPKLRHRDIQECRVDNVGEWLMQTEEFRSWHDLSGKGEGDSAVLFCYGNPGVGKTFISSLVVDRLCDRASEKNTAVTCFYFDFAAQRVQSATNMLGSVVKQIVSGMKEIPEEISRAFHEQSTSISGPGGPQLANVVKMLQAIASSQPTFICVDALDECAEVQRVRLLDSLNQILEKSPGTRIFATGGPHIRAEMEGRLAGRVISVSVSPTRGDITEYLCARLVEDETPDAMDESLEADILEKIPQNISARFLLIALNIEAILQESTIHRRRLRSRDMEDGLGLGDAYGGTIERIKAQSGDKSRLGMAALMWISHAERPLRADELRHALAIKPGSKDFNGGNIPSMSTLVSYCQGLITVDKEASTVRLIHFTLQEYLSARPDTFSRPHSLMAEACLTYLNSRRVEAISPAPSLDIRGIPFLEYCSVYWGVHAKKELSDHARSLALELFQGYGSHVSTGFLWDQMGHLDLKDFRTGFRLCGLHCASLFGIVELVTALVEMKCYDINRGDSGGYTPLAWAAHSGHEGVVKILLECEEINPDQPDKYRRTPVSHAARRGHEGVVKTLLSYGKVDPHKPDTYGRTPLLFAAWNGHEGVVKILLGWKGVNPDQPDNDGRTPLSYAAQSGHAEVVKILLEQEELNPDKQDNYGKTPLSYSTREGHERVVKILLGQEGVSPDRPSNYGKTPLVYAAWSGHEGLVKILLAQKDVGPDKPDDGGRTPLSYAAWKGHEGVVKLLLGREEVHRHKPDNDGITPLMHATERSHKSVIALLQTH